jgi:hypothetical protein
METSRELPQGGEGHPGVVYPGVDALAATNSETGAKGQVRAKDALPPGGEDLWRVAHQRSCVLAATIAELRELQVQRRFCIASQSRCDRSIESLLARALGFDPAAEEKTRKAVFAKASTFRKDVEKGGEGHAVCVSQAEDALAAYVPLVLRSAQSRESWDGYRAQVEKRMAALAKTLPAWPFVEGVRGFGALGLAIVIGETGDLCNYATKERVWKRLGLAVIAGERQQRRVSPELAALHGYSPRRRSEMWSLFSDSMFRAQWRGARDDAPAHPIGPYGEAYARRKAHTEGREWTPAHRHNDALRIMTKALIEDLWKAWRAAAGTPSELSDSPRSLTESDSSRCVLTECETSP